MDRVYYCVDILTNDHYIILVHPHMLFASHSHLKRKIFLHAEGQYLPMGIQQTSCHALPHNNDLSMRNHEQTIRNQTRNHNHNTVYSHSKAQTA